MKNPVWKVVTIGYTHHKKDRTKNPSHFNHACTSTLIEAGNRKILVDPGSDAVQNFETTLFHRSQYQPDEIDTVFLTHFHINHWRSISLFRKSVWLMSRTEIRWWLHRETTSNEEKNILSRIVPIEEHTIEGIEILPSPGHTHGLTSLMFETREGMVVVAGDAILDFEHFDCRESSSNAEDAKEARRSIDRIAKVADVIVPGHDNYFVV